MVSCLPWKVKLNWWTNSWAWSYLLLNMICQALSQKSGEILNVDAEFSYTSDTYLCVCVNLTSSWHRIYTGEENIMYPRATTTDNKYIEKDNKVCYTTMKEASINIKELNLLHSWGGSDGREFISQSRIGIVSL